MSTIDTKYIDLCRDILANGSEKGDRTGTGTISVFGRTLRHNLSESFPILTTKSVHFKSVVGELLFFLRGDTNIKFLQDHKIKIWDGWCVKGFDYLDETREGVWIPVKNLPHTPYFGDFSTKTTSAHYNERSLKGQWIKMMKRCYDVNAHNYSSYGGVGVSVSEEWHDCTNFINDVKSIPNWELKLLDYRSYELDKDYFGSKTYSKDTCLWLHTSENNSYIGDPVKVSYLDGTYELYHSFKDLESITGLSASTAHRWLKNGVPKTKKQGAKIFENIISISYEKKDGFVYRRDTRLGEIGNMYGKSWRDWDGVDQIASLIHGIKSTPNSRRLLVSAWNPADLPDENISPVDNVNNGKPALAPCHYSFQCYVDKGKLSILVNQRSADLFLGAPFNLASYALLCHMLAQVCGLEVGELIWSGADVHIYKNHIEQVKTQIERYDNGEVFEAPTLVLNKDITDIDDFTFDDIQLINYKNAGKLTGEVAV